MKVLVHTQLWIHCVYVFIPQRSRHAHCGETICATQFCCFVGSFCLFMQLFSSKPENLFHRRNYKKKKRRQNRAHVDQALLFDRWNSFLFFNSLLLFDITNVMIIETSSKKMFFFLQKIFLITTSRVIYSLRLFYFVNEYSKWKNSFFISLAQDSIRKISENFCFLFHCMNVNCIFSFPSMYNLCSIIIVAVSMIRLYSDLALTFFLFLISVVLQLYALNCIRWQNNNWG